MAGSWRLVLTAIAYHHRRAGCLWSTATPVITTGDARHLARAKATHADGGRFDVNEIGRVIRV